MKSKCWSSKLAEAALFYESTNQEAGKDGAGESRQVLPRAGSTVGESGFTAALAETSCVQVRKM